MTSPGPPEPVVVIVPALNEEAHIAACLRSLLDGPAPRQILVMDGGSTDRTRPIAEAMAADHPAISVVHNPGRLQSAAVNLGARLAAPDVTVLVRADAHASYPPDFVATCAAALRGNGATSVVVPMVTRGDGAMQRAVAAAQNSRLGNGGSAHRTGGASGFVEHGHHAAFDRAFFLRLGGYNETFTHNEDAELDVRALRAGGRIWMCRDAAITYHPRDALGPLFRQYVRHGRGRARTLRLHRLRPRLRQMLPVAALAGCAGGIGLGIALHPALFAVPLFYAAVCQGWAALAARRARDPALLLAGPALMAMHLGWACGFLRGIPVRPEARACTSPS